MSEHEDGIQRLQKLIESQNKQESRNKSPYMHGFTNGLILALAMVINKEPEFMTSEGYMDECPYCKMYHDRKMYCRVCGKT